MFNHRKSTLPNKISRKIAKLIIERPMDEKSE
jgi:hypothetical protein